MPRSNENQVDLLDKFKTYLSIVSKDRPEVYRLDHANTLKSLAQGHCSGITTLWFYYKLRGKEQYFYDSIMTPILTWDGRKESLSKELEDTIEYALSSTVWLQAVTAPFKQAVPGSAGILQSDSDVLINLVKQSDYPTLRKEDEIAFVFTNDEFKNLLEDIPANKLIRLASSNHVIGLFFDKDTQEYVLFDSNGFLDEDTDELFFERRFDSEKMEDLISNIQSAFLYEPNSNLTGVSVSVFDDAQNPLPDYPDNIQRITTILQARKEEGEVDLNEANQYDNANALYFCSREGHLEEVQLLLSEGARIDKIASDGFNPIQLAAQNGHIDVLKELLITDTEEEFVNKSVKSSGVTPLYLAAMHGHVEIVELLLAKEAHPDIRINDGSNSVHVAAHNGHTEVLKLLLDSSAGKMLIDSLMGSDEYTPLDLAIMNNRVDAVSLLLERGAKINEGLIEYLISENKWQLLKAVLDSPIGKKVVNVVLEEGKTPLYLAAENSHSETVQLLLQYGGKINKSNTPDPTVLKFLSTQANKRVEELRAQVLMFSSLSPKTVVESKAEVTIHVPTSSDKTDSTPKSGKS